VEKIKQSIKETLEESGGGLVELVSGGENGFGREEEGYSTSSRSRTRGQCVSQGVGVPKGTAPITITHKLSGSTMKGDKRILV